MNNIINQFLLAGYKFMSEMHLRQPGFTHRACGPFTKNKTRRQKIKAKGDSRYIYRNEIEKPSFQHNMTYGDYKNLLKRTTPDKVLYGKAFKIASCPKLLIASCQCGLASMV